MKTGFVAIVGRSNVGKSTIINAILETKLSIVTNKTQTTRNCIKGIYNDEESQIIFVDTPGIHKAFHSLGHSMNKEAINATKGVEAVLLVVDGSRKFDEGDNYISQILPKDAKLFIIINKIDLIRLTEAQKIIAKYKDVYPEAQIIEMSAINNFNIDFLIKTLKDILPDGPAYFPDNVITDKDASFFVSEVIREKLLKLLKDEVPHNIGVKCTTIKHKAESVLIEATIIVERKSHKGIVIGENGKRIKKIGIDSRKELINYFNKRIFLELFVTVKEDWLNNQRILKELGYK